MLILTDDLAELFNDGVLSHHFLHLLFNHRFLGIELVLEMLGNFSLTFVDLFGEFHTVLVFQVVDNFILPILYVLRYFLILESFGFFRSIFVLKLFD